MALPQVGQRYWKVGPVKLVWEVVAGGFDLEGIRHCRIVNVNDRTSVKLISELALADRKLYRLFTEQ